MQSQPSSVISDALPRLPNSLAARILGWLGCPAGVPSVARLNRLIRAHIRRVPWETVSRIIKRGKFRDPALCPRLPDEFWDEAFTLGNGGTCFENNYAFAALLGSLGYQGYLTINDLGEGCRNHCATTIEIGNRRYLADVTLPIDVALPFSDTGVTRRSTPFHTFSVRPLGNRRYQIERTRHSKREAYVLSDEPVRLDEYERAIADDYGPAGLFLDRVIIVKIKGDTFWRFSSSDTPRRIEGFDRAGRHTMELPLDALAKRVADHFGMHERMIMQALQVMANRGIRTSE